MTVDRLRDVPGFSIDRVAAATGDDPEVLRLECLDTDLRPPDAALEATRAAVDRDADNSYLPFVGQSELREAATRHVSGLSGVEKIMVWGGVPDEIRQSGRELVGG